jgi:site-specific recombinase XerD
MRKSFAKVMYQALGYRIEKLQKLLGHKWITSTISYISDIEEGLEQAVLDNGVGLV